MEFCNVYRQFLGSHDVAHGAHVRQVADGGRVDRVAYTGKSFSEALILASTNPQYDKRLFIELRVQ